MTTQWEDSTEFQHADYTVACVCAMKDEMAAMSAMFDEEHPGLWSERNQAYRLGRIGDYNVVVTVLPNVGTNDAAAAAIQLLNDFRSIKLGLLVGVGGGAPGQQPSNDVRLGDVVVSEPGGSSPGVVQFDRGENTQIRGFVRKGVLNKPPEDLRGQMESLKARHDQVDSRIGDFVQQALNTYPKMKTKYGRPVNGVDELYESSYSHQDGPDCRNCDKTHLTQRPERDISGPQLHYGIIGSSNVRMSNALERDRLRDEMGVLCVEMEAAGLMDRFPCLVVRGICDYADSHWNRDWQGYASMVAAAYVKELLSFIPARYVLRSSNIADDPSTRQLLLPAPDAAHAAAIKDCLSRLKSDGTRREQLLRVLEDSGQTCEWLPTVDKFQTWKGSDARSSEDRYLYLTGNAGSGKSVAMRAAARSLRDLSDHDDTANVVCDHYFDARVQAHDSSEKRNAVLQDLLFQLLEQILRLKLNGLRAHFFRELGTKLVEQGPNHSHICAQYIQEIVATQFSRTVRIWFVIDAIDESQHELEPALRLLKSLVQPTQMSERPNEVRLFASYRRDFFYINGLPGHQKNSMRIDEYNGSDVIKFVDVQLSRSGFGDDKERLRPLLKNKSQGNFLWVYLILEYLFGKQIPSEEEDLKNLIDEVPEDLSILYDRILSKRDKMEGPDVADSHLVFQLLLFAERKLKLREIRHALALTWTSTKLKWKKKAQAPGDRLGDRIVRICLALVDVSDDDSFVSFIHDSVRVHLMKDELRFRTERGHHTLFSLCLKRLDYGEAQVNHQDDEFYKYATRFWPEHAYHCETLLSTERPDNLRLLEDPSKCKQYGPTWVRSFVKQVEPLDRRFIRLKLMKHLPMVMVARGCKQLLQAHFRQCGCAGGKEQDFPRFADTALLYAVQAGQLEMVRHLLDTQHYDSLDAPVAIRGITALYQACFVGHEEVVEELLDRGARLDVDVESHYVYPLHAAARYGRLDVIETILEHDTDNAIMALGLLDSDGLTPKQRALDAAEHSAYELIEEWEINHKHLLIET